MEFFGTPFSNPIRDKVESQPPETQDDPLAPAPPTTQPPPEYTVPPAEATPDTPEEADPELLQRKQEKLNKKKESFVTDLMDIMGAEGFDYEVNKLVTEGDWSAGEKKGFWQNLKDEVGSGVNTVIRNFTRVGRASGAMIVAATKDLQELAGGFEPGSPMSQKAQYYKEKLANGSSYGELFVEAEADALKKMGTAFDYIKSGFKLEERSADVMTYEPNKEHILQGTPTGETQQVEIGSARDLFGQVFGDKGVYAFEQLFNKDDEAMHLWMRELLLKTPGAKWIDEKTTLTPEEQAANEKFREARNQQLGLPKDYTMTDDPSGPFSPIEQQKAIGRTLRLVPTITYIGTETLLDPTTYVGFKPIKDILTGGVDLLTKGSMIGVAKISPRTAEAVTTGTTKLMDKLKDFAGAIDKKYGAISEYKKVLGDGEEAINTVEDVKEAVIYAKTSAQEKAIELNQMITPKIQPGQYKTLGEEIVGLKRELIGGYGALQRSITRSVTKKFADMVGYSPENAVMKYLVGMDDRTTALEKIGKTLIQAGDSSSAILPKQFAEVAKDAITLTFKDSLHPEEIGRLSAKLDGVVQSGLATDETTQLFSKDLKGLLDDMKTGASKEGVAIAKDRRDLRFAELRERYSMIDNTLKTAREESDKLAKELNMNVRWHKAEAIKDYKGKLVEQTQAVNTRFDDVIGTLKKNYKDFVDTLRDAPAFEGTALERSRYYRTRDAQLAKAKLEFKTKLFQARDFHEEELGRVKSTLQQGMFDRIKQKTTDLTAEYANKTSEVLTGLPSKDVLNGIKEKAFAEIKRQFGVESEFFSKQASKVKFLNTYAQTIESKWQTHQKIFEDAIKDLPESWQGMARRFRSEMDLLGLEEVNRGDLKTFLPNYFPRVMAKSPKGGFMKFDEKDFLGDFFRSKGTGASRFSQERKFQDFNSFKTYIEKNGGQVQEDPIGAFFDRYQKSKLKQSLYDITQQLPANLKTGAAGQKMTEYLRYLFGGTREENTVKAALKGAMSRYSFYNKALLTVFSPAYYVKDTMGYPFLVAQRSSMKNGLDAASFIEATALKLGFQDKVVNKLGEEMGAHDFMESLVKHGLTGSSFTRGSINETLDNVLNRYSKMDPRYWVTKAVHAGQTKEDIGRTFAALTFWKDGLPIKEAVRKAKLAMYDFNDWNYIDRSLSGMFAFYGFARKNLVGTLKGMSENPQQFAALSRVVDNFSYGHPPTQEDMNVLQPWDKEKFQVFTDFVQGKHSAWSLGFTPVEDFYQNAGPLLQGDIDGFLGTQINKFSSDQKLFLKRMAAKLELPWAGAKDQYQFLPKEYSTLPDGAVEDLNKVSRWLGYGSVVRKDRIIYENGEPIHDRGVYMPPKLYDIITSLPTSRVVKDNLGLIRQYQKVAKSDGNDASTVELLSHGLLDADTMFRYLTGIRKQEFDWEKLKDKKARFNYNQLVNYGKAVGVVRSLDVIPKDLRKKYEDMLREEKERQLENSQ